MLMQITALVENVFWYKYHGKFTSERFCGTFFNIKTKNTNFLLNGWACKFFLFKELIELVGPSITKKTTNMRLSIVPNEKLPVTLRFLTPGESYKSLWYQFRIHRTTVGRFVPLVCPVIQPIQLSQRKISQNAESWGRMDIHSR